MPVNPKDLRIAPSLIAADFKNLTAALEKIESSADLLHVDVMDGHFVPNITFGPFVVQHVRKITKLPLDVHLMISKPRDFIPQFADAGATTITFHLESDANPDAVNETIDLIYQHKCGVGISVKPGTPFEAAAPYMNRVSRFLVMTVEPGFGGQSFMPEMLAKVRDAVQLRRSDPHLFGFDIEVDGGLAPDTIGASVQAGAEVIVAGTSVFGKPDPAAAIAALRVAAELALKG